MKIILILFLIMLVPFQKGIADVSIQIHVPDYKRNFGVVVKGNDISRIAISVPECLGHLAFDVRDGYIYSVYSNKNCVMRVIYRKDTQKK